jgi:hypothetical protein
MTKHLVIIAAALLVAGTGYALPQNAAGDTWATEEELLSAPGSAGYAVDEDRTDAGDALESPLCDCDTDEGEDGFDHAGESGPGDDGGDDGDDGGDGGDDGAGPGSDDDEPGC